MEKLVHTSDFKPRAIPLKGTGGGIQINRIQDLSFTVGVDRSKIEEVGRKGIVGWREGNPGVDGSLTQLEYGNIQLYNVLANQSTSSAKVELQDLENSATDIVGYKTDEDGNFLSTIWYPKLRVSGFSLNIGDPESLIERSFSLVGENEITLQNDNKYLIFKTETASGGSPESFAISDPAVVPDPDNSGAYLFKVVRVRSGTTTELDHGDDWSCDGSNLYVNDSQAGDTIKYWYSAGSYISGQSTFTNNDSDEAGLEAKAASIYLVDTSNYLYSLQNVGIDVSYDRFDRREIGNDDIILRGAGDTTVTITLGRILDSWTIEEVLRGVGGLDFGKLDVREFGDSYSLIVKLYSDASKETFKCGYKFTQLAPTSLDSNVPLNDYVNRSVELTGESGFVTNLEANL